MILFYQVQVPGDAGWVTQSDHQHFDGAKDRARKVGGQILIEFSERPALKGALARAATEYGLGMFEAGHWLFGAYDEKFGGDDRLHEKTFHEIMTEFRLWCQQLTDDSAE